MHAVRRRSGWLALIPLLWLLTGCGDAEPPWSCSWAMTPSGVTAERLAGTYTGKAANGAPVTLVLSPDGRYTATALEPVDWYTGDPHAVDPEGTWRMQVEDKWDIPLVDEDPPHAKIALVSGELDVGGSLDAPVLYDAMDDSTGCGNLPNVLRRTG